MPACRRGGDRAALDDARLGVGVGRRKLAQQERGLPLRFSTGRGKKADHRLQRPLVQHAALDVLGGMHQVADDADGFVVHPRVVRAQHLDQGGERAALDNLVFVVLVLERERAQRARGRALDLGVARLQQRDQGRHPAVGPHARLDYHVLVGQVGDGVRRAAHDGRARGGAAAGRRGSGRRVAGEEGDEAGEGARVGDGVLVLLKEERGGEGWAAARARRPRKPRPPTPSPLLSPLSHLLDGQQPQDEAGLLLHVLPRRRARGGRAGGGREVGEQGDDRAHGAALDDGVHIVF